jgi:hypothetical protein
MSNFVEKCLSREAVYDDIDDFIDQWHQAPQGQSIYDFLGMTRQEYALWVIEPSVLPTIISAHAHHKNLDEILEESKGDASGKSSSPVPQAKELVDWLKTSKFWKHPSVE